MTENLIDRLKKMKKEKEETKEQEPIEDIEQCACGSNLKNECDECDRIDDDHEVLQKIREIGDKKEVNPPKPENKSKAVKMKRNDPSGTCPACEKEFKHLSRHRCKNQDWAHGTSHPNEEKKKELEKGVYAPKDIPPKSVMETQMSKEELMEYTQRFLQMAEEKDPKATKEFKGEAKKFLEQKVSPGDFPKGTPVEVQQRKKELENGHKYDLYINAEIVHNGYENLKIARLCDLVEPFIRQIEEKKEVAHWSLLDYEKGSAFLAALLEEAIEDGKLDCDAIIADSRTKEGKACLDVLQRHAGFVVRGVV
jgi:hypothetical protein